jgi:hypothetical protein
VNKNRLAQDLTALRAALANVGAGPHCRCGVSIVRTHVLGDEPPAFPEVCELCQRSHAEDHPRLLVEIEVVASPRESTEC